MTEEVALASPEEQVIGDETTTRDRKIDYAKKLVDHLEAGEVEAADEMIRQLGHVREGDLFNEVGRLTRELHDALRNVNTETHLAGLAEQEMPDARQRLRYVIDKTEESAHRTLGVIEELMPVAQRVGERSSQIIEDWQRFTRREMSVEEFRDLCGQMTEFLEEIHQDSGTVQSRLSDVMMAQDFQDLTGQVLNRIIDMVQQVEDDLVSLIRCAARAESAVTEHGIESEGPRAIEREGDGRVNGQDDVDDLLASLGF